MKKNIYGGIPEEIPDEIFEEIFKTKNIKIKKIVSYGHFSPQKLDKLVFCNNLLCKKI